MRKFLLVVLIAMVLAMNLYAIANELISQKEIKEAEKEVATTVYYVE